MSLYTEKDLMSRKHFVSWPLALGLAAVLASQAKAADPWADHVVNYTPGTGITNDFPTMIPFNNPLTVLGEPTRFTSPHPERFGGAVTPLNAPFRADEIVSVGRGGELVVRFDEPVVDDPANPYGVDLLVFGNAFFVGSFFNPDFTFNPAGTASGVAAEGGLVEVSADGVNFFAVAGDADGLFPTNGYADLTDPFATIPGAVPANFTLPVNPRFDPVGKTYAEILAGYAGSGGGLGIDLAPTGLSSISFMRISNSVGAPFVPEIDALTDVAAVPEPAASTTFLTAAALFAWQIRNRRYRGARTGRDPLRNGRLSDQSKRSG